MNADLWYPMATAAAAGGLLIASQCRNGSNRKSTLHGSARWANQKDLRRAGLLDNDGVYVGGWMKGNDLHYLRSDGGEHVLAMGPTGAAKTISLVVPTLLSWKESAFVLDLKGELWALTAGWRQTYGGNRVLRFEPAADVGSCCFNPLDEIRIGTRYEAGDAQNVAMIIVDPDGKGPTNFWDKSGQTILSGCILHLCLQARAGGPPATLPELDRMLASPNRPILDLWKEMQQSTNPIVAQAGQEMMDRQNAPSEASGILSTAKACLSSLFRDPVVARNVSRSDFAIADLMQADSPVSLYLVTEADDKVRMRPLVRILANLVLRRLASGMSFEGSEPVPSYRHRLLLMLDEFPSLGRLAIFEEALAYIRGYGIKAFIVAQDLAQLHAAYGKEEGITGNCGVLAAFPPARLETAEHLSKLCGTTTIVRDQVSRNGRGLWGTTTRTRQETARPLLTPDECRTMPGPLKDRDGRIVRAGQMLVFVNGQPAIRGVQPLYFQDPIFKARAALLPPVQGDALLADCSPEPAPVAAPDEAEEVPL
jgi:type IV secretion system protein VirD4